jgi:Tfp pilus assembly protein PilX
MTQINYSKKQSGFALLMTILVLSVVVAVTLAIVELSLKQLKLAVDSTDSEIAFHAANAGLECARYTRRLQSDALETGGTVTFNCFGNSTAVGRVALGVPTNPSPLVVSDGRVSRYQHSITWGTAPDERCTAIDMVVMVATTSVTIGGASAADSLQEEINGYETDTKTCDPGERCTIISVSGYSSPCASISNPSVLKREILLEL